MLNSLQQMHLKLLQKEAAEAMGYFIGKRTVNKISETVTNENDKEFTIERYTSPKKDKKLLMK